MSTVNEHPIHRDDVEWVEARLEALDIKADQFGLEAVEREEYDYLDAWMDGYGAVATRVRRFKAKAVAK